jgi:hypothetical protein
VTEYHEKAQGKKESEPAKERQIRRADANQLPDIPATEETPDERRDPTVVQERGIYNSQAKRKMEARRGTAEGKGKARAQN